MRQPTRNRDIYELVESNMKLIEEKKMIPVKDEEIGNQVKISISKKNALISDFWIKDERIMKIDNNRVW